MNFAKFFFILMLVDFSCSAMAAEYDCYPYWTSKTKLQKSDVVAVHYKAGFFETPMTFIALNDHVQDFFAKLDFEGVMCVKGQIIPLHSLQEGNHHYYLAYAVRPGKPTEVEKPKPGLGELLSRARRRN